MEEIPNNSEVKRDEKGRIIFGSGPLNPVGRPKGKTLKEFAREMLMSMDEDEKRAYLKELPKEIVWRMSEGNPHQTTDFEGEVTIASPLLHAIRHNDIDKKDLPDAETNTLHPGGDGGG